MFPIQWPGKSHGKKKVRGTRSSRNRAYKSSSVAQEESSTTKSCKYSIESAGVSLKTIDSITIN